MSSIADRFQDPAFVASLVGTAVLTVIGYYLVDLNWPVSFILAGLISGSGYILYQDFVEKRRLENAEDAKQADLQRRIKEQAETELASGKCVSCTAVIPDGAEECPECGYPVKHYTSVKE